LGARIPAVASAFARNLKRLRDAAGLSQEELAQAAHSTQPAVAKWEAHPNPDPHISTVLRLAAALEVSVDALVVGMFEDYDRPRLTRPVPLQAETQADPQEEAAAVPSPYAAFVAAVLDGELHDSSDRQAFAEEFGSMIRRWKSARGREAKTEGDQR
jgi:transcriptional regulator with XRE-family HTH domain